MPVRILLFAAVLLATACGSKKNNPSPAPTNPNLPPPIDASGGRTNWVPPANQPYRPAVTPAVQDYQGNYLDPRAALNGMGRWVQIDGQAFFVPDFSQSGDHEGWEPYQNGFWSYDEEHDWTWNSSDRWGWVTDHYGVWRHHRVHGWIWAPFAMRLENTHYQPHCVTWFDESEDSHYLGWYPYYSGYDAHYRRFGQNHGFDDGFWEGPRSVLSISANAFGFRLGITMVQRTHVTQPNIRRWVERDRNVIIRIARNSHRPDRLWRVGRYPGGDRRRSLDYIHRWTPHQRAPIGRAREVEARGGARILQPFFERRREERREERRDDRRDGQNRRTGQIPAPTAAAPVVTAPATPRVTAPAPAAPAPTVKKDERRQEPVAQAAPAAQPRREEGRDRREVRRNREGDRQDRDENERDGEQRRRRDN